MMDIKPISPPHISILSTILLFISYFPALSVANPLNHTSRNTIMLITSLANAGRAEAQYTLARCYLKGRGVSQSYSKAREWLLRAAKQQHANSQNQLGIIYANGLGIQTNCKQAKYWFNQIAPGTPVFKRAQSNLAWVLSTCPITEERNGKKAVQIVQNLLTKQKRSGAGLLDTLAAAYAETGQFEQATHNQQQAIVQLLTKDKNDSGIERFKQRLESYQQDKPWHNAL